MTRPIRTLVALAVAAALARCAGCDDTSEPPCPSGQELCGGLCVDPASYQTSGANCGACGIACGLGTCVAGACQCTGPTSCPTSVPRCPDTENDRTNCGGCGNVCQRPNEACANGACQCVTPPFTDCGASCANLETDAANCGGCGAACLLAGELCVGGQCQCPTGEITCPPVNPSKCVDPARDTSNCGTCGTVCATGASCDAGQCACPTGESVCSGACVNTKTDASHCGGCGTSCAAGASCANGLCTCPPSKPTACGSNLAGGTCCEGTVCCGGSTCGTKHSNGLGQFFYDCNPLGTYDAAQAASAARAWRGADPGPGMPGDAFLCPGCTGWRTPDGTSPATCATWCYAGTLQGRVFSIQSLVCTCTQNPGTWN